MNNISNEMVDKFIKSAEEAVATVERVECTPDALNNALSRETANDQFVLLANPDDIEENLFSTFKENKKVITAPTLEELKTVRTGITDAFCGIAETGSVCVSVTKNFSSPISMLTRNLIVVVKSNTILPKPRDVFDENNLGGKGYNRSFSFITGPSATADMGPLVRGVHGPGKLHIIVLD
ncbi:MAG: LUD domain-containing protein [Ignavibacteria bacterium]|jgi:L-lactate dehydrogenase complex protein LldG